MPRKFIYFINPVSGTKGKDNLIRLIQKRTEKEGIPYEVMHTNASGNYEYLIDKIMSERITDIIVCGGDGTVNQIAAALLGIKVNIGIIPMGSGNGLALAAGISRNANKALNIIFKGNASDVDGFFINTHFGCMLCGLGFDAQVAHDFANQPTRGLKTYIKQTLKNFVTAKTYRFRIKVNDINITTEAFFISIANSNQFGNNVTIAPKASIRDGLIDVVVVNKMSKSRMLYSVGKQLFFGNVGDAAQQKNYKREDVYYYQSKRLFIENTDMAPLHIDGDPMKTAPHFEIEIMPNAFRLLQP